MTTNDFNAPPLTADLHRFLKELPKPFREQLLVRLFAFFKDEIQDGWWEHWSPGSLVIVVCLACNAESGAAARQMLTEKFIAQAVSA